jgi:hypothetical protein
VNYEKIFNHGDPLQCSDCEFLEKILLWADFLKLTLQIILGNVGEISNRSQQEVEMC